MEKNSRAITIWGKDILNDGSCTIPSFLIRNRSQLNITNPEWQLLELLFTFKLDEKDPFPSQATLAYYLGITERQVRNLITSLKSKGLLDTYRLQNGCSLAYNFDGLIHRALELQESNKHVFGQNQQIEPETPETEVPAEAVFPVEASVPPNISTSTLKIFKRSTTTTSIQKKNSHISTQENAKGTAPLPQVQECVSEQKTVSDTHDPFTLIERQMMANAPDKKLRLKERDNIAIKRLLQSDVPLQFILSSIDQVYEERPYTTISAFTYLEPIIIERWAKEVAKMTPVELIDFNEVQKQSVNRKKTQNTGRYKSGHPNSKASKRSSQLQHGQRSGEIYGDPHKKSIEQQYSEFYDLFPEERSPKRQETYDAFYKLFPDDPNSPFREEYASTSSSDDNMMLVGGGEFGVCAEAAAYDTLPMRVVR